MITWTYRSLYESVIIRWSPSFEMKLVGRPPKSIKINIQIRYILMILFKITNQNRALHPSYKSWIIIWSGLFLNDGKIWILSSTLRVVEERCILQLDRLMGTFPFLMWMVGNGKSFQYTLIENVPPRKSCQFDEYFKLASPLAASAWESD
jgi:hypothetical protein